MLLAVNAQVPQLIYYQGAKRSLEQLNATPRTFDLYEVKIPLDKLTR
jgi:hypothetical protein